MLYYKEYFLNEKADWVVFVHGAGGSSAIWFKQLKDFKAHFNLLLIVLVIFTPSILQKIIRTE